MSDLVTHAVTSDATLITIRAVFDDGRLRIDVHAQHDPTVTDIIAERPADARPCESFSDRVTAAVADAWGRDCLATKLTRGPTSSANANGPTQPRPSTLSTVTFQPPASRG